MPEEQSGAVLTAEINQYIAELDKKYCAGNATEHSYRPALQSLFERITSGLSITNEPKRIACGAPDYIVTRNDIPIGYIEAKDILVGIHNAENKAQFERYKSSLGNLIITDYINFELFIDGSLALSASIAQADNKNIKADKSQYGAFFELVQMFAAYKGKTIADSGTLAQIMAARARLLATIIVQALPASEAELLAAQGDALADQLNSFRDFLIHSLSQKEFADIFAQTIAYGMFAARLNVDSSISFTRMQAALNIPQSNPFLQKFFQHIAGYNLDDRIRWIVDALADLFNCVAVEDLLKEFGKARQDPYIHFYETFLAEYDPVMRKGRGVWYTPLPVVRFIVGAADDILKTEFNLSEGLADKSKVALPIPQNDGKPKDCEFHRVQILDPATGTGTFLAAVIDKVYEKFAAQQGKWAGYCAEHLIPRLNGFEILMASYAMAHFKLDMKLKETGCRNSTERLRVFLTNSLDSALLQAAELPFAQWLATESAEARKIKRDVPIMVMLANPPYNISTQNKGEWIDSLIAVYKTGLHEKKLNLDDDYIKFIRYGQYYIDKNKSGIEAYISNNSFIDGVTHRQMRKSLLQSFDKIYILNLHGSAKKKETAPDGGKDENVFDIQQGVSVNIFIKTGSKKEEDFATVYYHDLYGNRDSKYSFLLENTIDSIDWKKLDFNEPYYFFTPKIFSNKKEYENGFSITELFTVYNSGIKTDRDSLFIDFDRNVLTKRVEKLLSGTFDNDFRAFFSVKDSVSYKLTEVIKNKTFKAENIRPLLYRPFDMRYIYYEQGITSRPAFYVMKNIYTNSNVSLLTSRCIPSNQDFDRTFATNFIADIHSANDQTYVFPLYLYPDTDTLDADEKRRPNLEQAIIDELAAKTGLQYTAEKEDTPGAFAPLDVLDYIYAVLHSPAYRETYREFLKIDFPRVPYPADAAQFRALCRLGARLRTLHLFDGAERGKLAAYPIDGTNRVEKTEYRNGRVWINRTQYFDTVPQGVWDFYVGGYQPAQKWLKDRKRRELRFDDIEHYQQIIAALQETIALQTKIDAVRGVRQ